MVRNYKRKTQTDKNREKTILKVKKARRSKQQKQGSRISEQGKLLTNPQGCVNVCLEELRDIFIYRIKNQENGGDFSGYESSIVCYHLSKIGSSQLIKLNQPRYKIHEFHRRHYYIGANHAGKKWELKWAKVKEFYCKDRYTIKTQYSEPHRTSLAMPWLCATPDFISLMQKDNGDPFWAVVEVKSVKKTIEMSKFKSQIQAAMSCFGLNIGFLVIYNTENRSEPPHIEKIEQYNYLEVNRARLEETYFTFLARCIGDVFNTEVSVDKVRSIIQPVLPNTRQPKFEIDWCKRGDKDTRKCYYNGNSKGYVLKKIFPVPAFKECRILTCQKIIYALNS